ncbi:hypothetical protein QFC24_000650 [Naganishia onofrii]|uniref:Uncharacterized protein n=1 Tax=Naganishia onofrii TaxID=1851511 RepID=A0ACC2XYF8_9TREE|nr:hypothetical protein QFC24_000650 [Naganishia onofrii]
MQSLPPSTSRAAINSLTCLRAFPRLRKHTLASATTVHQKQELVKPILAVRGYHGLATARRPSIALVKGQVQGYEATGRRWAGSAVAVATREEEDAAEDGASGGWYGGLTQRDVEEEQVGNAQLTRTRSERSMENLNGSLSQSERIVHDSLSALDDQLPPSGSAVVGRRSDRLSVGQQTRHTPKNDQTRPLLMSSHRSSDTRSSKASTIDPQISSMIQDTELILDQALLAVPPSSSRDRNRSRERNLPWPIRHLRLRTVRPVDVEHAENAFHQARQRLARLEQPLPHNSTNTSASKSTIHDPYGPDVDDRTLHKQVLRAHINHLLYLSARIPDPVGYKRIMAYLREYELEPDGWTWLTRLVLVDKVGDRVGAGAQGRAGAGGVLRQLEGVCRDFNRRTSSESGGAEEQYGQTMTGEETTRGKPSIDGDNATVLLNMTLWILAKRGQWSIVGPAYNKLLSDQSSYTPGHHPSSAFPLDYFTPSHDLSTFNLFFNPTTNLNKITYQSLIRALAYHGNIVPALAVMQDMMNDKRGYTVGVCDYVSLFQGFARFGTIPVGWEAMAGHYPTPVGDDTFLDPMRSLRPQEEEDEYSASSARRDFFPPPIFPGPLHPGPVTQDRPTTSNSKKDAMKQMTEIWAGNVGSSAWNDGSSSGIEKGTGKGSTTSGPSKLEKEWTLVTLQQVFHSFLATSPSPPLPANTVTATTTTTTNPTTTHRRYWDPSPAEAPSPRNIYYIMLAFARTTDRNKEVLRAVWKHLEGKFGDENEEGWVGWRLDARLRRMREWLGVAK